MPAAVQLLVVLAAVLVFWAVVMRPARTQQRKVEGLQQSLEIGQQVVLSAGIFGTVRALDEGRVQLEIAPGTVITVARQVVVRRAEDVTGPAVPPGTPEQTPDQNPDRPATPDDDVAPRHED